MKFIIVLAFFGLTNVLAAPYPPATPLAPYPPATPLAPYPPAVPIAQVPHDTADCPFDGHWVDDVSNVNWNEYHTLHKRDAPYPAATFPYPPAASVVQAPHLEYGVPHDTADCPLDGHWVDDVSNVNWNAEHTLHKRDAPYPAALHPYPPAVPVVQAPHVEYGVPHDTADCPFDGHWVDDVSNVVWN